MPREYSRKLRVAAELQRLLNEVLRVEVKDPRLDGVAINDVELSGDLGVAKVYYGTLDPDEDEEEAQAAFASAAGFLRSRVGHALRLRRVPELHFIRDTSARQGLELSRLIDSLDIPPESREGGEGGEGGEDRSARSADEAGAAGGADGSDGANGAGDEADDRADD